MDRNATTWRVRSNAHVHELVDHFLMVVLIPFLSTEVVMEEDWSGSGLYLAFTRLLWNDYD